MDWQPIARIILRYLAVPLGLWLGLPSEQIEGIDSDPDVVFAVGAILASAAVVIEGWYVWAKTRGGAT